MAQLKDLGIKPVHWVYPSNLLSLLRVVLIPPGYLAIVRQQHLWTFVLLLIAVVSDMLDGYLARRLGQITELGKLLDPIADKLAILTIVVGLVVSHQIPLWVLLPVLLRDLLILLGGYLLIRKHASVPMSNIWGKLTTNSVGWMLLAHLFPVGATVRTITIGLMLVLILVSTISYAGKFSRAWETATH